MIFYCKRNALELHHWFELGINWQLLAGVRVNRQPGLYGPPAHWILSAALGPFYLIWTFPTFTHKPLAHSTPCVSGN